MGFNIIENARAQERRKAAVKIAIAAGIGIAAGTALGILIAPKTGKETREDIAGFSREKTQRIISALENAANKIKKEAE